MGINVAQQCSHIGEKLLRLTYDDLGVKLTGTLEVCDRCARLKAKAYAVINKTYPRATNMGESIFVETTGPFPENITENCYWIVVVYDHICYSWSFFTKTKLQLQKKWRSFLKMTAHGTPVEYLHCNNSGKQ